MSTSKKNSGLHFLHDLLNHTHGLKLFLESQSESVNDTVLKTIYDEVHALENQIASQFDSLNKPIEFKATDILDLIYKEFKTYHIDILYGGITIGEMYDTYISCDDTALARIIKNISKNIHSWGDTSSEAHVIFDVFDGELNITIENKINPNPTANSNGLGLNSISELSKLCGMKVSSFRDEELWITQLRSKILNICELKQVS